MKEPPKPVDTGKPKTLAKLQPLFEPKVSQMYEDDDEEADETEDQTVSSPRGKSKSLNILFLNFAFEQKKFIFVMLRNYFMEQLLL